VKSILEIGQYKVEVKLLRKTIFADILSDSSVFLFCSRGCYSNV